MHCEERLHEAVHPASMGGPHEVLHGQPPSCDRLAQCLKRDIDPHLVPVLEEVGDGLGDGVDLDRRAFDLVRLDAVRERLAGEAHDPQRRGALRRLACPRVDREPHFPRVLDGQAVKHEG